MEKKTDSIWQKFVHHPLMPKTIVLLVLMILLWFLKPFFNLIMMTLFLTILMGQIALLVRKYLHIPVQLTIVGIYSGVLGTIAYFIYKYWHSAVANLSDVFKGLVGFYSANPNTPIKIFDNVGFISAHTQYQILQLTQKMHINEQLAGLPKALGEHIGDIGHVGLDVVLAILLSFVITMELPQLAAFNKNFYHSKLPRFFRLLFDLLHQFIQSFMVAIDTQLTISVINMVITTIGLYFLGYSNLWLLALMVWVFSLIPVLGALLSFVPLAVIGFASNGLYDVVMVGLLLIVVHALEAYVINPRLMAHRTKLPEAYTLIALILGDLYLGVWGLLLAVPILTFILDFLGIQSLPKDSQVAAESNALKGDTIKLKQWFKKIFRLK